MKKLKQKSGLIALLIGILQCVMLQGTKAQTWSAVGNTINGEVFSIGFSGSNVVAGGYFYAPGSNYYMSGIAQWNGTSWSSLGYVQMGWSPVNVMTQYNSKLVVGGNFTVGVGNPPTMYLYYLGYWNGSSWSVLNNSLSGEVDALAVSGTNLYVGGDFSTSIPPSTNLYYIGRWNGSSWWQLGNGMNGIVRALAVYGGNVYAGGDFTTAGGNTAYYIAKWNGSSWSAVGTGMNNSVNALLVYNGYLFAGGTFTTAGGNTADYIARWDGSSWSAVSGGMNSTVNTLATDGTDLFAGGNFTTAGGNTANYVARYYTETGWTSLGTGTGNGTNNDVFALAVDGSNSNLYVGGTFSTAGGNTANYIAKWSIPSGARIKANVSNVNTNISVYPNPNNGIFSLNMEGSGNASVIIYNLLGKQVYHSMLNSGINQVNLSSQSQGIYLYRINANDGSLMNSGKIIIQ